VPPEVVAAGLLHDTVEDTTVTLGDIRRDFGETIAILVDGVTKTHQSAACLTRMTSMPEKPSRKNGNPQASLQLTTVRLDESRIGIRNITQDLPRHGRRCPRRSDQIGGPPA